MTTLNSAKRNTSGVFDAAEKRFSRVIDVTLDLSVDATMGTATDDIQLVTLPAGTMVQSATIQQVAVGTGTGTLALRVGTTAVTATLASTAAVGTVAATVPAALPLVVPVGGLELNVLGATAVRTDGRIRVIVILVEGDKSPREPITVLRDAI